MQPAGGGRGGRPTATSWVQMSATNPTIQSQNQHQQELNRSSLSSAATTTNSSGSGSTSGPLSAGTTTTSSSGSELVVSAPNSFVGGGSPRNSMTLPSNELTSIEQHLQQVVVGGVGGALGDDEHQQEENRKLRLQLYVFVLRCISYPFNAKQTSPSCLHHKNQQLKLRKPQLEQIIQLHTRYTKTSGSFAPSKCPHQHLKLSGPQLRQLDELYELAHVTFNMKFLQNERMRLLVESECFSQQDLRELFRQSVEHTLAALFTSAKQQQQHQLNFNQPQGSFGAQPSDSSTSDSGNLLANREIIINSWLIKFESIIREDSDNSTALLAPSSSCAAGPELQSAAGNVGPVSSLQTSISGASGGQLSTSTTTGANLLQQQQQQISKEQLYQMFQNILNIKKFEHQLLYNALQLDSSDEQAAAIRRELDGRISRIAELERNKKLMPKFVLKEMESLYLEETRMSVNKLMVNLDSLPVMKGSSNESRYGLQKFRRYNNSGMINEKLKRANRLEGLKSKYPASCFLLTNAQMPLWSLTFNGLSSFGKIAAQASLNRDGLVESHPSEPSLTKLDVVLTFNIEVIVMEVRGLRHLVPNREIYCTMEIEGSERLQTEHVQAKKPLWDTQGDFTTNHPLPVLKIKLYAVNPSMLSLEDKELGKLVLRPTVLSPKTPEWCSMQPAVTNANSSSSSSASGDHNSDQELKIRVVVRMDRPQQLKHCGYLYGIGKSTWRKLKRRYHILIQVSQYTFVMCSYRDKKAKPTEMLQLDGYTVDYIEPPTDLIMEHCTEITSNEHHGSSGSTTLGLAGMLANRILKQPSSSANLGSGSATAAGNLSSPGDTHADNPIEGQSEPSAIQTAAALSDELHSKYYFNVVKEGDSVVFACDDEQECFGWVMALYRATGQAHKPTPLRSQYSGSSSHYIDAAFAYNASATQQTKLVGNSSAGSSVVGSAGGSSLSISSMLNGVKGGVKCSVDVADQRARKHGMDEFISADPCKFQHQQLFKYLQNETLRYRLDDLYCSIGWFSPGQVLVLDEYCARYGVRTCFRHLAYLNSLLDFNQRGYFIDHTLLNYGYDFCASHVSGNSGQAHPMGSVNFDLRPDGIGTVTVEERDMFHTIKMKLIKMIERQIANFAYCFPFGKPDGALKAALSLLERVLMKEQQTNSMVQNEEVRQLIRKCLEQAALNNYTKLSGQANLLQPAGEASPPPPPPLGNRSPAPAEHTSGLLSSPPAPTEADHTNERPTHRACTGSLHPRSPSNLSSSSLASYASSTVSSSTGNHSQSLVSSISNEGGQRGRRGQMVQQQQCLTMATIINNEHIKAKDKLRYLIRLAELCCEQVEENNEYFSDAFAWHSDLMMDHFELFWSLFSVDMDKVLNELALSGSPSSGCAASSGAGGGGQALMQQQQQLGSSQLAGLAARGSMGLSQSANSALSGQSSDLLGTTSHREVFALFQLLNNHMRKSPNLECRKFKAYLCDTFRPKLLRHIDIMESTMTRMLFKACEKDGQVNCMMIEQMFTKLDDLQRFVLYQLRWPDDQLADQMHQRLKLIAYELCDACVQRTLQAFQQTERRSNKWTTTTTSYASPVDMIQMINLALETRNRSLHLCTFNNFDQMSYHSKIDKLVETALNEMQPGLMSKMIYALESTLSKLARYDEGNLLAPILSLTYKQGMSSSGRDIGKQYVSFVSNCCDLLRQKIDDELWIVNLLEEWYAAQMNIICTWLAERIDHSLHDVQLAALITIMPKIYADMSLQGVTEDRLNLKPYQTIMSRLKMEEAAALAGGNLFEQPSTSIFTTSLLSSLTSSSSASTSMQGASSVGTPPSANMTTGGSAAGANSPPATTSTSGQSTLRQQSFGFQQQQQQQQQKLDSPTINSRRSHQLNSQFGSGCLNTSTNDSPLSSAQDGQAESENIADRALQSATRMFKGFWAS